MIAIAIFGLATITNAQNWNEATPFASPCGQYETGIQGGVTKLIDYNNELYASGNFIEAGGLIANCIARWNGSNWNTVYQGDLIQNSVVYDMIVFNNKLYFIGNHLYTWDGSNLDTLTYLDQNTGDLTSIPGASSNFCIYNGNLYLGAGGVLFKVTPNNLITSEIPTGVNGEDVGFVTALEVFNGNFYLGSIWGIYKNLNGSWVSITGNTSPQIKDLAVFENHLYALGNYNAIGLVSAFNFAKYDGLSWTNEQLIPNTNIMSNQTSSIVIPNSLNIINNALILTYPTNYLGNQPHVFAKQNGNWTLLGGFDPASFILGQCYTSCLFQNEIYVGGAFGNGVNICNLMKSGSSILNVSNNEDFTVNIFPNPASTEITIDYDNFNAISGYSLTIVNSMGQVVFTTPINQQTLYIDPSTWVGNGIYFVQLIDPKNNTIENRKIVIQ